MKREDFIFSIGYAGTTLVVDSKSQKKWTSLSCKKLLEKGLYLAAIRAAVYENDQEMLEYIRSQYAERAHVPVKTIDALLRIFGVEFPSEEIQKVLKV